jgi:exodeoxyribonuclease-5
MTAKIKGTRSRRKKAKASLAPDLNADQARAVAALTAAIHRGDPMCRLLGYAGTGKSFAVVRLLQSYVSQRPVLLTAPTNKAAAVLRAMALAIGGPVRATTIHKALGLRPEGDTDQGRYRLKQVKDREIPEGALVVIDECSMVDRVLMRFIRQGAEAAHAQLLWVGDPAQLPPIFEAESPTFSGEGVTACLTEIVRQQADHPILSMTQRLREAMDGGPVPRFETRRGESGSLITLDEAAFEAALLEAMQGPDAQRDPDYCRVLAWTNARTQTYNQIIRRTLRGPDADQQALLPGEKVVACTPILEAGVSIGDTVTVLEATPDAHSLHAIPCLRTTISTETGKGVEVWVVRPEGQDRYRRTLSHLAQIAQALQAEHNAHRDAGTLHRYSPAHDQRRRQAWVAFFQFKDALFADLRPIHASTAHRSQGSTYQTVFVDLTDIGRNTRRDVLLRLLYVGLTRARGDVYVTGELPARLYREESDAAA